MALWWLAAGLAIAALLAGLLVWGARLSRATLAKSACDSFRQQRDALRQQFLAAASVSGKPKGLHWRDCEWDERVEFVRHRQSGELAALASLTVHFEAVEGGDMEGVAAVGLPRNASAVFFFAQGRWHTLGKAIFNKNPDEAAAHFGSLYERLPQDETGPGAGA